MRSLLVVTSLVCALGAASATAVPVIPIHPALPYENDEVFVARYDIACNYGTIDDAVREPIPGGWRVKVPVFRTTIVFTGEVPTPCVQSIGVLGAGRHEVVAAQADEYSASPAGTIGTTIVEIPAGARPPEANMWTYVPSSLAAVRAYDGNLGAIARMPGNLFAAIARDVDRDFVTTFGRAPGDWRRLEAGFPGPMEIAALHADGNGTLYAFAWPRASPSDTTWIWRFDPIAQRWSRHAEYAYEDGQIVGLLRNGALLTVAMTVDGRQLRRLDPATGWRTVIDKLPDALNPPAIGVDDTVVGVLSDWSSGFAANRLLRFDADTGETVSSIAVRLDDAALTWIEIDAAGQTLAVSQRPFVSVNPTYSIHLVYPDGTTLRLVSNAERFPFAAGGDGSYLSVDRFQTLRYHPFDAPAAPIARGGLGPSPVCGDATAGFGAPFVTLCGGTGSTTYYPFDEPRNFVQQVNLSGTYYTLEQRNESLLLMRRTSAQGPSTPYVDLMPALDPGPAGLYAYKVMRLAGTPDEKRLYLLVHQYLNGDGFASRLIEIDLAQRSAAAVAMPPLLSTDMTVSPAGHLYVTTRAGEVLRRMNGASEWTTIGHLSTRHFDLHVTVSLSERVYVYGFQGVMAYQGTAGRLEEFHHAGLDHYFMTAAPEEIAMLEAHPEQGWLPTGQSFAVIAGTPWGPSSNGTVPREVCRFYGSVDPGPNSHFYTVMPNECSGLKALQQSTPATLPRWNYEGTAFFSIGGTAGGNCPQTEQMITRYYNGGRAAAGTEPNHRYVGSAALAAQMDARKWILEFSAFCVPFEPNTRVYAR